jgi:uncharacterized protein (TIGR03437 family)
LEDFDIRAGLERSLERSRSEYPSRLFRENPRAQIRWSSLSGTPSRILSLGETLGGQSGENDEIRARRFLKRHNDLFKLSEIEVDKLKVSRLQRNNQNGIAHLTLQQEAHGIDVFHGEYTIHLTREGDVISAGGELIPDADRAANRARPVITSAEALKKAAEYADLVIADATRPLTQPSGQEQSQLFSKEASGRVFARDVESRLVYFPLSPTQLRLAWEFSLWLRETTDVYLILVDAERGSLLYRYNLTWHCFENMPQAVQPVEDLQPGPFEIERLLMGKPSQSIQPGVHPHGLVYLKDSPRPDSPHINIAPPYTERQDAPFGATPFNGSVIFTSDDPHYDWWAGKPTTNLISNNADVHLDRNGDDLADAPGLTVTDGNFSFPIDLTKPPTNKDNQRSAQVNLFYWVNRYHDILYHFGFNEAAGNFQKKNFNLGGLANDPIQADAQDGSGTNNANYSGGRDGSPGRIQMFLWSGNPQLDGDFDQSIILHELTHGLTTRLVGNGTGLTGIQGRGMGEGWSDYFGLVLLRQPQDDLDGQYAIGQYSTNNYARGIRRFPYSTDQNVYPLNFGDITRNTEVHAVGEIWCNTLLEMRALLIRKLGFEEGHRQSIQLVIDGLKLTPISPNFLDARNAILLADRVNNAGANQCLIWQAFNKRGMGFSAITFDTNDGDPVEEFDMPSSCSDLGTIRFDQKNYLSGETINFRVGDRNATATIRVRVQSSNTRDEEILTLTAGQIFAGDFRAGIPLSTGPANPGDGILQASLQAQDKIIVIYDDPNDGHGSPSQVVAQAEVAGEKIIFEDTVEHGNQGWSASTTSIPSWSITEKRSASPAHSWTDSINANYANNTDNSLVSPLLNLSQAGSVTLAFAHSYHLERGFDYGIIDYSRDDGSTWKRATAFTGAQPGFTQVKINLDALAGEPQARIRFRLKSDSATSADGWNIDDIRIISRSSDLSLLPPQSDFKPLITSVSPSYGLPNGNTAIMISGANFTGTEDLKVFFDGIPATNVRVSSAMSLSANTPQHEPGPVDVRIETRNGSASLSNAFTYFASGVSTSTPQLISLFPTAGTARGGTVVTLNGSNFTPDTTVSFGMRTAKVTFINSNTLKAISPVPVNYSAGAVDVTASNSQAQQSTIPNAFNYVPPTPPIIQVLNPDGGERLFAGSTITIRWKSSDNRSLAKHRIELDSGNNGSPQGVVSIAGDVAGEAQSFNWKISNTIAPAAHARIRIVAIDDEGAETEAYSKSEFTIEQRWESMTRMIDSVQRPAVAGDGKYLYVFGGRKTNNSRHTIAAVQRFDPSADPPQWTIETVPPMPNGLNAADATFIDGRIYIPGGIDSNSEINSAHLVYDVTSNTWSNLDPVPKAVFLYALAADPAQSVFYLTGGSDGLSAVPHVRAFDTRTNKWSDLPPMNVARFAHEAAFIDGKLYVVGGSGITGGLSSGEVYDLTTRRWSPIAGLNRPRHYAINAIARDESGRLFWLVIGGEDANTGVPIDSIEAYDVAQDHWILLDGSFSLPAPRTRLGGAILNGYIHAIGGAIPSTSAQDTTAAHERFKPDGLSIIGSNQPPIVAIPPHTQIAIVGQELRFSVSAQDLGSTVPISIMVEGLPEGAGFEVINETNNSARGLVRWTPGEFEIGHSYSINFTASDGQLTDVRSVLVRVVSASQLTAVNAADFRPGPMAADSIGAAFGIDLAIRTELARSWPLPLSIAETTVTINGIPAPLFFVSPAQINFLVPPTLDLGAATIVVSNPQGVYAVGRIEIATDSPAIFTADATGIGDAAALATDDGINYQHPPFNVLVNGKPNILVLYGTGFRGANTTTPGDDNGVAESVSITIDGKPARVLYAGAQGGFSGLDQINVEIPATLAGRGLRRVEVMVTVNGVTANRVTIQIE